MSMVKLRAPCIITSRLMAGVEVGDGVVSIGYSKKPGDEGRARYLVYIDIPGKRPIRDESLQSGVGGGSLREGLESFLAFLSAFAEAHRYGDSGRVSENSDLFPARLAEWAVANSDEIGMVQAEVEETEDCIVE